MLLGKSKMPNENAVKWQSRTPKFPKIGLVICVNLRSSGSKKTWPLCFLTKLDSNFIIKSIKPFRKNIPVKEKEIYLIPVRLQKTIPLKREHWKQVSRNKSIQLDIAMEEFKTITKVLHFMLKPANHKLLVNSTIYKDGEFFWPTAVLPIKVNDQKIDDLMGKTIMEADATAKNAAIYINAGKAQAIDYNKGSINYYLKHLRNSLNQEGKH